jgi:tetratricopeptide (TPR) repeat protein
MKQLSAYLILGFFLLCQPVQAFYYTHEMSTVPENYLKAYQKKHHLSDAFQKLFDRGSKAYYLMDYKRAEQVYNTLLLINSRDIIALDRIAQVYTKQGRYLQARKTLEKILVLEPAYYAAYHQMALVYLYEKQFKESIQAAKILVESGHAYEETYIVLLNALFQLGQFDNVVALCKIARNAGGTHPLFNFFPLLIDAILGKTEAKLAKLAFFTENYAKHPQYWLFRYVLGVIENDRNSIRESDKKLRSEKFTHPTFPYAYLNVSLEALSFVTREKNIRQYALKLANTLTAMAPDFLLPYRTSIEIFLRNQDYENVLVFAKQGLEHFPEYIPFYEFQGEAAFFRGEYDLAQSSFETSLASRKNNPEYIAYYAILLLLKGDTEHAYDPVYEALAMAPNNPYAQTALGFYFHLIKEEQRALTPLQEAVKTKIPLPLPYKLLIDILIARDNTTTAYKYALNARLHIPDKDIHLKAAELSYQMKEYHNCIQICSAAVESFPDEPLFRYYLASALKEIGDTKDALTHAEKFEVSRDMDTKYALLKLDLLMDNNQPEQAHELVENLLRYHPREVEYLNFLASYQISKKQYKEAQETYENIGKISGHMPLHNLGWVKFLMKKREDAINDLTVSMNTRLGKEQALAIFRLALIHSLKKSTQNDAIQLYEKGDALFPNLKQAKDDHKLAAELNSKHKDTILKNMELYLK